MPSGVAYARAKAALCRIGPGQFSCALRNTPWGSALKADAMSCGRASASKNKHLAHSSHAGKLPLARRRRGSAYRRRLLGFACGMYRQRAFCERERGLFVAALLLVRRAMLCKLSHRACVRNAVPANNALHKRGEPAFRETPDRLAYHGERQKLTTIRRLHASCGYEPRGDQAMAGVLI